MNATQITITVIFCLVSFISGIRLMTHSNRKGIDLMLGILNSLYVTVLFAVIMYLYCTRP